MNSYHRIIPRDLFNEAKLLKCLGRIALLHHDGMTGRLQIDFPSPEEGFHIAQDESSGALFCDSLFFSLSSKGRQDTEIYFSLPYNNRDNWPLHFYVDVEDNIIGEQRVFDEEGNLTDEFKEVIKPE